MQQRQKLKQMWCFVQRLPHILLFLSKQDYSTIQEIISTFNTSHLSIRSFLFGIKNVLQAKLVQETFNRIALEWQRKVVGSSNTTGKMYVMVTYDYDYGTKTFEHLKY